MFLVVVACGGLARGGGYFMPQTSPSLPFLRRVHGPRAGMARGLHGFQVSRGARGTRRARRGLLPEARAGAAGGASVRASRAERGFVGRFGGPVKRSSLVQGARVMYIFWLVFSRKWMGTVGFEGLNLLSRQNMGIPLWAAEKHFTGSPRGLR